MADLTVYNEKILEDILADLESGETEEDLDAIGMGRDDYTAEWAEIDRRKGKSESSSEDEGEDEGDAYVPSGEDSSEDEWLASDNEDDGDFGDVLQDDKEEDIEKELSVGMNVVNLRDNELLKIFQKDVIREQEKLLEDAPKIIKPVMLMLIRNGISNYYIKKYKPNDQLINVIHETIFSEVPPGGDVQKPKYIDVFQPEPNRFRKKIGEYYDAETEEYSNEWWKLDLRMYTVNTPGHIMALMEYDGKSTLYDSNGNGTGAFGDLLKTFPSMKNADFKPHKTEFTTDEAMNIFIAPEGRCASWTLFVLLCFEPVLEMENKSEMNKAMKDIEQFLTTMKGSRARVMSSLVVGMYTRLQLWYGNGYPFKTTAMQRFFMPDKVKRSSAARKAWKKLEKWKAIVKKRTEPWLLRDNAFSNFYHELFGEQGSRSSDRMTMIQKRQDIRRKVLHGGKINLIGTRSDASYTKLIISVPMLKEFHPFHDHGETGEEGTFVADELYELTKAYPGIRKKTELSFLIVHKELEKHVGSLRNITWGNVFNFIQSQIEEKQEFWKTFDDEYYDPNFLDMFKLRDNVVHYKDRYGDNHDFHKNWALHVQQEIPRPLVRIGLNVASTAYENDNYPVLLDKPFPLHFNSKLNDSSDYASKKRNRKPEANKIYLTFDHLFDNVVLRKTERRDDFGELAKYEKYYSVISRTDKFLSKLEVYQRSRRKKLFKPPYTKDKLTFRLISSVLREQLPMKITYIDKDGKKFDGLNNFDFFLKLPSALRLLITYELKRGANAVNHRKSSTYEHVGINIHLYWSRWNELTVALSGQLLRPIQRLGVNFAGQAYWSGDGEGVSVYDSDTNRVRSLNSILKRKSKFLVGDKVIYEYAEINTPLFILETRVEDIRVFSEREGYPLKIKYSLSTEFKVLSTFPSSSMEPPIKRIFAFLNARWIRQFKLTKVASNKRKRDDVALQLQKLKF